MTKPHKSDNPDHYRSPVMSGVRFLAQDVLLKSTVWSLCKVHVHGRDLLENVEEPFIVIANHSSHFDAPLILGSLPRRLSKHVATGAAADYFFDKKLKGLTTSLFFNAYPIERKGRTHKGLTGRLLDAGIPLLIFPEGTRSRTGALGQFKPGVAGLSISRNVPCIPMALVGAFAAWPYNRPIPPTNHPTIHVVIGHPLTPITGETASAFTQRMQSTIAQMYDMTARAYGMPTLDDFARTAALKRAEEAEEVTRREVEADKAGLPQLEPGGDQDVISNHGAPVKRHSRHHRADQSPAVERAATTPTETGPDQLSQDPTVQMPNGTDDMTSTSGVANVSTSLDETPAESAEVAPSDADPTKPHSVLSRLRRRVSRRSRG
ncbi:MAG: 1-acyl-sn-glycerol-3-phosphate acyltransferase [Propionibacteriaceae bacterium]|jgi:1-acyl-sn-glycerol-3-phosphate acyltransferase|nr:1-acyl-sn-glycerol-3-phosphate acyltransferase [Propionibacteriaceae bacterium]